MLTGSGLDRPRDERPRLLVVTSHPIQYQAPLYRLLATSSFLDLRVLFLSDFGTRSSFDPGYSQAVRYDVPLTGGYEHVFARTGRQVPPRPFEVPSPALLKPIWKRECDVLLVHGYASIPVLTACLIALLRKVPFMVRGDTNHRAAANRPAHRRLAKRILIRPLLRRASVAVSIGKSNTEFYRAFGIDERRIVVAPFSVDTASFTDQGRRGRGQRSALLKSAGLDPALPTIVYAGKFLGFKRPLDVLAAARLLSTRANILLIGDGPLRAELESASSKLPNARVVGFVNQSRIGEWFGASDVIVLPSARESWGLVVNEAMATGCIPVVSDAVGCAPDLVEPSAGSVFPVGDVAALASTLESLLSSPKRLAEGRRLSQEVADTYSLEATARGFESAVAAALASRVEDHGGNTAR